MIRKVQDARRQSSSDWFLDGIYSTLEAFGKESALSRCCSPYPICATSPPSLPDIAPCPAVRRRCQPFLSYSTQFPVMQTMYFTNSSVTIKSSSSSLSCDRDCGGRSTRDIPMPRPSALRCCASNVRAITPASYFPFSTFCSFVISACRRESNGRLVEDEWKEGYLLPCSPLIL